MTRIQRSVLMPYSDAQMFDVVNDVARYPEFLPWCRSSQIDAYSEGEMIATLALSAGGLSYAFTTRNTLEYPGSIHMELVQGFFQSLDGRWQFTLLGSDGCKVSLDMAFRMESRMLSMGVGQMFSRAADKMVEAFCTRAENLYGR